ncbi:MAG: PAS domain-containing sensor histidine kinase [Saprospiraceae bacterium]|nr:PAS domain-containing sensor histidine kinase [Saprospiraceae bacterium]
MHREDNPAYSEDSLRLKAIIETATDGVIIIDSRGRMEMVNPAAAELFGYDVEEMKGKNVSMLMPQPHRGQHDTYIQNYLRTGEKKIIGIGREVKGKKKNGSVFPCRLSISELKMKDRTLFTGIIHDLTQQKMAEERIKKLNAELEERVEQRTEELAEAVNQLLDSNKQLEKEIHERKEIESELRKSQEELQRAFEKEKELSELKSRFVSMASHEFRTPLSTILSSADLIEEYKTEERHKRRLRHTNRIKSAVANLTGILNDFLSLSKLEEGRIQHQPVEIDLNGFCQEIKDDLSGLLKAGQEINLEGIEAGQTVFLDKKILKNILFNLLSNAIKYSGPEKPIFLKFDIDRDRIRIAVVDQGIGIPAEEQQHLFSRFFRARNVENIQGTGLGLNIVKKYVDLMGGSITFESVEGEGSTFLVTLPRNNPTEK